MFIDEGDRYNPDGRWYAFAAADANGNWYRVLEGRQRQRNRRCINGWFVLAVTSAGKTTRFHYNGVSYADTDVAAASIAAETAKVGSSYPTEGWKIPASFMASDGPAQDQIMRAAGLSRSGNVWKGCEGASEAHDKSVAIRDLNHDGRPEAIVTDGGYQCYGNAGQKFTVLRPVPGGWAVMMQATRLIDHLMKTTGVK